MDGGNVVTFRPAATGSGRKLSVFLEEKPGNLVEYEIDGMGEGRKAALAAAALLEAIAADLRDPRKR